MDIAIEDRGETIPEDLRQKIFERFFRIDASRSREAGGSGLGLAIAKWAVEANGGSITYKPGMMAGTLCHPAPCCSGRKVQLSDCKHCLINKLESDDQQP